MRIPLSWLREYVTLPEDIAPDAIAAALTKAGLEVEAIEYAGADVTGPVVIGKVLEFVGEPQKNGKVINWCQIDVGEHNAKDDEGNSLGKRGIICGAHNFAEGDYVVAALPGAVLPGDFAIASRKTYGHISDGMLCAVDELNMGTDHTGIIVLPEVVDGHKLIPGEEAAPIIHLRDVVFVVELTPDQGYCQSVRGIAREIAQGLGCRFTDPVELEVPAPVAAGFPVQIETDNCTHFTAVSVSGVDPTAQAPRQIQRRLQLAGMRSISLAVDVTNYVMLETGQPLHAYDAAKVHDRLVVRQAEAGEKLTTLDGVERTLDAADLVIADADNVIGLAGVMGGASTEVDESTTAIVLEAAHFDPVVVARAARRHNLGSEASKRFERFADPAATYAAAHRAAKLLQQYGGGAIEPGETVVGEIKPRSAVSMSSELPSKVLGRELSREQVIDALSGAGVHVTAMGDTLSLVAPTWRPDLTVPQEFVEEVARKTGIDDIPSVLPSVSVHGGLTAEQRARRDVASTLAHQGMVEVLTMPFIGTLEDWGIDESDQRRHAVRIANPLTEEKPFFRSTLLPGLAEAAARNMARSMDDLALFEIGRVAFQAAPSASAEAPILATGSRPSDEELAGLDASLPNQVRHLAGLWTGKFATAPWQQAFAAATSVGRVYGVELERVAAEYAPFHPGRCAQLTVAGTPVGYAGELHPQVIAGLGLTPRAAALELDLDALAQLLPGAGQIGTLSTFPVTKEDLALVVDESVTAADVKDAIKAGAGELLESAELFDVYRSEALGEKKKSLAFALRFRATDHTLAQDEVTQARQAAIARAAERTGAELRAL